MLEGKWPEECVRCKREHEIDMPSRNIYERDILAKIIEPDSYPSYLKAKTMTLEDGRLPFKGFPSSMDIRFGNHCNLKCVMCGPTDSNQWYDDHNKIWGYKYFTDSGEKIQLVSDKKGRLKTKSNIYEWSENAHLWRQIEKNITGLRRIYIAGGEPLLIARHYDFLEQCIEKGIAKYIMLKYNSNITVIPPKARSVWKSFKKVTIGISIDGIKEVNDLIRYPSKWNNIEKNLFWLNQAEGSFVLHIAATISLLNIWHLPEMIEYFMRGNFTRINTGSDWALMSPHPAHKPHYLNTNILEESFKERIEERFSAYKRKWRDFNWPAHFGASCNVSWEKKTERAGRILDSYVKYMRSIKYSEDELAKWRGDFIHSMDKLDELRGTSWPKVLPELYESSREWRK